MKKGAVRLKTSDEIRRIAESGRILSQVFARLETISLAGMSTWELDSLADEAITHMGARAAFKTLPGYGYASCISLNSEAAHGIPERKKIIKQGDLVKVDIGIALGGYFSDACRTFVVEPAAADSWRLVNVCREALAAGIDMARAGNHTVDIGRAVETVAREAGFSVIRAFTGHGTGFSLHESPVVPHWDTGGTGEVLREGMVLAIEPVLCAGKGEVRTDPDGWTSRTVDGSLAAQFEETVAVTGHGPLILTRR